MTQEVGGNELAALVAASPLLRRPFDAELDRGPFVVTGNPADWGDATAALRAAQRRVVAYHDRFWRSRRLMFALRPVLPKQLASALADDWLFAGQPRKRFFDAAPAALNRCRWHVPLTPWRQSGRGEPRLLEEQRSALEEVLSRLADQHSKETYASLVRGRVASDSGFYSVAPYAEYAHPVVRATPGDVVIDAGAYDGDSARRYAWQLRGRGKIVALEPDAKNFARLARSRIPGLVALNLGVWSERTKLSFSTDLASSRITEDGAEQVEVCSIDEIVAQYCAARVDVIKLDVEGAEHQALDGAERTISRFRPKLQVSIYHRPADLFELPLRLMRALPDYRWYLGHHGPWHTETDLYGMPRERLPGLTAS